MCGINPNPIPHLMSYDRAIGFISVAPRSTLSNDTDASTRQRHPHLLLCFFISKLFVEAKGLNAYLHQ